MQSLPQALVQVVQLSFQPGNVGLNPGTDGSCGAQTVLLRDQYGSYLVPAGNQGAQDLGFGVPQRTHGRSDDCSEMGELRCVQSVGLGQFPRGPGEVPHLSRVDDDHWDSLLSIPQHVNGRHPRGIIMW